MSSQTSVERVLSKYRVLPIDGVLDTFWEFLVGLTEIGGIVNTRYRRHFVLAEYPRGGGDDRLLPTVLFTPAFHFP